MAAADDRAVRHIEVAAGTFVDHTFRAMGCDVRVFASGTRAALGAGGAGPDGPGSTATQTAADELVAAVQRAEALVHACAARLTRFDAGSELRRLSAEPQRTVAVSPLLARAIELAVQAAEASGGLIDPTLSAQVVASGYGGDWDPARRLLLDELLRLAPPRSPASPAAGERWRELQVDRAGSFITRPPGLQLDLGATAKGFIADLALRALGDRPLAFVDAGGDVAITADHLIVDVEDPFGRAPLALEVHGPGAVATSSIAGRCWQAAGGVAHHLLDPSTGRPAFTGVVQATAIARTAAEAERIAGRALLSGPAGGAAVLARYGGLLVLDDGTIQRFEAGGRS